MSTQSSQDFSLEEFGQRFLWGGLNSAIDGQRPGPGDTRTERLSTQRYRKDPSVSGAQDESGFKLADVPVWAYGVAGLAALGVVIAVAD